MSASFLAALCDIPIAAELPPSPADFAVTETGQLVQIQRPERVANTLLVTGGRLGDSAPLGMSDPLGQSRSMFAKRASQGAGLLMSGVMLGALTLATPHALAQGPGESASGVGAPTAGDEIRARAVAEIEPTRPLTRPIHGMMVGHF